MSQVAAGESVAIYLKGWLDDGNMFVNSQGRPPVTFSAGGGEVIEGLSLAVVGMTVGETKRVTVSPEQAFGPRDPDLQWTVAREQIPAEVKVGDELQMTTESNAVPVWVRELTEAHALVDSNHPLAGQTLTLEIELVSLGRDALPQQQRGSE